MQNIYTIQHKENKFFLAKSVLGLILKGRNHANILTFETKEEAIKFVNQKIANWEYVYKINESF